MKKLWLLSFALLVFLVFCQVHLQAATSTLAPIVLTTTCPEDVAVYFLDVGQGDSILVKTPSKSILIDGGPSSAGNTVLNDLSIYNISKIDLMVATHPHADHIDGLIDVLQSTIPIQDIIYNGYKYTTTQTFNTWKTLALEHNLTQASRSQVYAMSPTINFTVLSPTDPIQFSDINAESIVMKLQVGNTSILLTGDAQFDTEQNMLSAGLNLHSQVLKVGHHGSSTSTSQLFLNATTPSYAVISAGINNTYGHPTQQTLDILTANNVTTYGTYAYGTIVFSLKSATFASPTPIASPGTSPTVNPTTTLAPTNTPTQNPTSNPTTTPTSTPTGKPPQNPNRTQTSTISPTPTMPEIPPSAIILVLLTMLFIAVIIRSSAVRSKVF